MMTSPEFSFSTSPSQSINSAKAHLQITLNFTDPFLSSLSQFSIPLTLDGLDSRSVDLPRYPDHDLDDDIDQARFYKRTQGVAAANGGLKFKIPKVVGSTAGKIMEAIPIWGSEFDKEMRRMEAKRRRDEEEEEEEDEINDKNPMGEMVRALRALGDGYMKMEQMKMEAAREMERARMKMELKRTEMILDSHMRIVDSFVKGFIGDKKLSMQAKIFHYGSISLITEPCKSAHIAAAKAAKDAGVLLSYDPNLRLPLWPSAESARDGMFSIWDLADIIKISEEEISFLTQGEDPYDDAVVRKLFHPNLRAQMVVDIIVRTSAVMMKMDITCAASAKDTSFGFKSSNLREWVEEKIKGRVPAKSVASVSIQLLRTGGPAAVCEYLCSLQKCAKNALFANHRI